MCEEVQMPEREVPKAMVLSVVAAGITGLFYLVPILFVLPDVSLLLAQAQPIGLIFKTVSNPTSASSSLRRCSVARTSAIFKTDFRTCRPLDLQLEGLACFS